MTAMKRVCKDVKQIRLIHVISAYKASMILVNVQNVSAWREMNQGSKVVNYHLIQITCCYSVKISRI